MYLLALIIFLQSTQNEKLWTYAQYVYDALGQRIRLKEQGTYENKTFTYDALLLFREVSEDMNIPNIYFRVQLLLIRCVKYEENNFIKSISTGIYTILYVFLIYEQKLRSIISNCDSENVTAFSTGSSLNKKGLHKKKTNTANAV